MEARDVEGVIRDFDDQWKQEYEDTASLSSDSEDIEHQNKDKDKADIQTQSSAEEPLLGEKKRPSQQGSPGTQQKKK